MSTISFTPWLRISGERGSLDALGSYSPSRRTGWTTQGALAGVLYFPLSAKVLGELNGVVGGSAHAEGTRTAQMLVIGRTYLSFGQGGVWAGAGGGRAWDAILWRGIVQGEFGGWMQWATGGGALTFTPTRVGDTASYMDAQLALQWTFPKVTFGLSGGTRIGDLSPFGDTRRTWGDVDITANVTRKLAVIAGVGTYPLNLMQGFPGGRFATLGIRWNVFERQGAPPLRVGDQTSSPVSNDRTDMASSTVTVHEVAVSKGQVTLRIKAPRAQRVEVMGDFTNWTPVTLTQEQGQTGAGIWTTTLHLSPGTYQMNVRINGGDWQVPHGMMEVTDEFGGRIGILPVPEQ